MSIMPWRRFVRVVQFCRFLLRCYSALDAPWDPDHIAPQMMGPKLLNHLHNLADFELSYEVGALAPDLLTELATERGAAMAEWATKAATTPMLAANFAASTAGAAATDTMSVEAVMEKSIDTLLTYRSGFAGLHPGS